ncbi:hypothetical protein BDZ89DRAFT_1234608 [Hymenopellis radicata]|nr:hypothetical protein BDZ89DRAFT_1234608 [Hymenopellis radicata]
MVSAPLMPHLQTRTNVQQGLAYKSLRTVTASVEIWYGPDPSSTIIKEDSTFVEALFAIPDEETESKLHLQSPWLLRLGLDRAKMWSEDNSDKLIIRCRVIAGGDKDDEGMAGIEEDIFPRSWKTRC